MEQVKPNGKAVKTIRLAGSFAATPTEDGCYSVESAPKPKGTFHHCAVAVSALFIV